MRNKDARTVRLSKETLCNNGENKAWFGNFKLQLERAVDGAPRSPTPGHDLCNRIKILSNMFSVFYLWEHTQSME